MDKINPGDLMTNKDNGKDFVVITCCEFQNIKGEMTRYLDVKYLDGKKSMLGISDNLVKKQGTRTVIESKNGSVS